MDPLKDLIKPLYLICKLITNPAVQDCHIFGCKVYYFQGDQRGDGAGYVRKLIQANAVKILCHFQFMFKFCDLQEADHMKKRKKMRRDNLKLKRLQKKKNIRKRRGVRSRRFCESDDSTDEDSGDGVGNKISRETVR